MNANAQAYRPKACYVINADAPVFEVSCPGIFLPGTVSGTKYSPILSSVSLSKPSTVGVSLLHQRLLSQGT